MEKATRLLRQNKLSLIVTALACLFTLILWPLTQRYPFALFIAAVLLTAWQEGPKSALVTTGLSSFSLIILCYFIPSASGGGSGWVHLANLAICLLIGMPAAYLSREFRRAHRAVDHLQAALASTGDALIFTDYQGRVTSLNVPAQVLVGWHPLNAVGQPLGLVFRARQADSGKPVEDFAARVLSGGDNFEIPSDAVLISSQGRETPIAGSAAALRDAGNRVVGMLVFFRDNSRQRLVETAARQREEQLRALCAKSMQDSQERLKESEEKMQTVRNDFDQKLKEREQAQSHAEEALRLAQEDWKRQLAEEVSANRDKAEALRQAHQSLEKQLAESVARHMQAEEALKTARQAQAAQLEERTAERKRAEDKICQVRTDLERQLAEVVARQGTAQTDLMSELAQSKAFVRSLQDKIAAQEAAEPEGRQERDLLKGLVESCEDGIFAFDRDFRFTAWNQAMERITGFEGAKVLGKLVFEIFPALDESGESRHFLDVLLGQRVRMQSAVMSQDGQQKVFDHLFIPYPGGTAEPSAGIVFIREVPEAAGKRSQRTRLDTPATSNTNMGPSPIGPLAAVANGGEENPAFRRFLHDEGKDWLSFN